MKKDISKKLKLNKRTIASLTDQEMANVIGGAKTVYGGTCGTASYDGKSCLCETRSASPLTNCSYQGCSDDCKVQEVGGGS